MAQFLLPIFTRAVRALAERALKAIAVLPELYAGGARMIADDAPVDDVAGAGDGFGPGAGVFGVVLMGLDGVHVHVEDALHFLQGWGGDGVGFWQRERELLGVCLVVEKRESVCVCVLIKVNAQ